MIQAQTVCSFLLNDMLFGIEVTRVQEVIPAVGMTPIPLAPPVVRGLINLRGQIVTALDVRRRLALGPREGGREAAMSVVIRTEEGPVSLLVDEIHGVLDLDPRQMEPPPDTLDEAVRCLIRGACLLEEGLLLTLDVDRLLELGGFADDLDPA